MYDYEERFHICGKCNKIYNSEFGAFQCCRKEKITAEEKELYGEELKPIGKLYKK